MIKIGISACLLGHKVRFDGGHKLDPFLKDTLGRFVQYVPVCPEVELGLGVPREPMRLVGDPAAPRLVTIKTGIDHTNAMLAWAHKKVKELEAEDLCGFIFKSRSPSSGMQRVKVYGGKGATTKNGVGLFAAVFMKHFPLVPVEEEGRLCDPVLRENFIERIFIVKRWRDMLAQGPSAGALVAFHTQHKLLLLSHSPRHYQIMGQLVAAVRQTGIMETCNRYHALLMEALGMKATVRKHVNVLQHMMGYFKKTLTADEKRELGEVIEQYRRGSVPLIVPLTLMKHYIRKYNVHYLAEQYYVAPHPVELKLRNHV
ncbi:MAG: DUF523 and DUF1722 domain-containing protein [Desulfobacterota bacterium]|nr:DUF523 and DUF1722 domain-containing protein [Thermodesulfobacteriota bacterium]